MSIERADFDAISEADLQELIEAQVPEGHRIEYKRESYGNTDANKREFLKDISAFANSHGGHLLLGVEEKEGVAANLIGLKNGNSDTELQRLEQLAKGGVEPRIPGLRMKAIPLSSGNHVLILRIPRSWNPPHRVIAHGSNRFYLRHSAGVHEPNVEELRTLFTQSTSAIEQARLFRNERLASIQAGVGERPLANEGRFIFHIIPVASFSGAVTLDLEEVLEQHASFWPIGESGMNSRFNYHGFINERGGDENLGHVQIFRNGSLEATKAHIVREMEDHRGISGAALERHFFRVFHTYLIGLRNIEVPPPLIFMITLEGVQGAKYHVMRNTWDDYEHPLPEDVIFLPECVLENYGEESDHHRAIKPAFDALWNAIGYSQSQFFNDEGVWVGQQQ